MTKKETDFRQKLIEDLVVLGLRGVKIVDSSPLHDRIVFNGHSAVVPSHLSSGVPYKITLAAVYGNLCRQNSYKNGQDYGIKIGVNNQQLAMLTCLGLHSEEIEIPDDAEHNWYTTHNVIKLNVE